MSGNYSSAVDDLTSAVILAPVNVHIPLYHRGLVYEAIGDIDKVITYTHSRRRVREGGTEGGREGGGSEREGRREREPR